MTFPVTIPIGGFELNAHAPLELLAYVTGFQLFRRLRARHGDFLGDPQRWTVVVAAILGAAAGSKLLHHLAQPTRLLAHLGDPVYLMGGKTIVGGLLGGLVAVEVTKKVTGVRGRTGDLYALPLCMGIAIGRIGCFLAGLADDTYGRPTSLPWGIDLGDGIARHPTALYEIVFLAALGAVLARRLRRQGPAGSFRVFMVAYLAFRLLIDFVKPYERLFLLGGLQWACLLGLLHYAWPARREPWTAPEAINHG